MTTSAAPAGPILREWWSRWRGPVIVIAIIVSVALVLAAISSGNRRGHLDPEGVDQTGSRALARILSAQGVQIVEARSTAAAVAQADARTTLLITVPDLLQPEQVAQVVETGADLVLLAPRQPQAFAPGVEVVDSIQPGERDPQCAEPVAARAGAARLGGALYASSAGDAVSCYPGGDGAALLMLRVDDRTVTLLGSADALTNQRLDEDGNAALALGLLGRHERLVWYRPTLEATDASGAAGIGDLVPPWVAPTVWQLLLAAGIAALWRSRRLGPVVAEPLPVVVRAAEVVEGRGRLYRRSRARDRVAGALRGATASRLARHLSLPPDAPPAAVVAAVAERTGRSPAEVSQILVGPIPRDDAGLVRLADTLDALEQEVLNS